MTNDIVPIIKVGSTDITAYVKYGPTKASGADRRIKSESILESNRSVLWSEGRKALGYGLKLIFIPDLADQIATTDSTTSLIDDLDGNQTTDIFYPGRSDRFAVIDIASVHDPEIVLAKGSGIIYKDAELFSEAAELYAATPSSWAPTDEMLPITQDTGETNAGNMPSGIYSLTLTPRISGPALNFDGTNDYITSGAIDLSGAVLSIELKIWTPTGITGYLGLLEYGDNEHDAGTFGIQFQDDDDGIALGYYSTGTGYEYHKFDGVVDPGCWNHLVFTINVTSNAVIAYKDGVKFGDTWTPTNPLSNIASKTLWIGARQYWTATYFPGYIAAVRIWKRILSAAEALDAYEGDAVSDTNLVLEYDFCEGEGATVNNLAGAGNDGTLTNFADTSAGYGDTHDGGWLTTIGPVSPTLELLSGATVMDSLELTPHLMTAEVLALDRFCQITQTYVDTFTATIGRPAFDSGYFAADGYCYAKYIDSEIVLTSLISGRVGEEISITITDTNQASTTVSVSGYDITVDLETSGGNPVATAQEVIDAINADADASDLVEATLASGEDGTTVLDVQAKTQLALNVNVTGGALVIEDNYEAIYHLVGSRPIKAGGLTITFTPTIAGSGTVGLDASADQGSTWDTVIDSADAEWTDTEEMEVTVPDSIAKGETEIWIRFTCDASATSLTIDGLTIVQERDISSSEVPEIPVSSTYKIKIDGSGWCNAASSYRNRFKP